MNANSSNGTDGDGPDASLNPERLIYLKFAPAYIYCMYLIIGWLIIGGVGNVLSFLVWISPRIRKENSSAVYLAALSVADLCLLVCTLLVHLHFMFNIRAIYNYPVICEFYTVPYVAAQYMSPLLVMAFTVERWIAICFPFRRDTLCTTRRACMVVAGLAVFTLALAGVHGTMFVFAKGGCTARPDQYDHMRTYSFVTEVMMSAGVPIFTLVCNVLVIRELRRIERRNQSLTTALVDRSGSPKRASTAGNKSISGPSMGGGDGSTNFKATTAMLLSVSFFLIFTTLPAGLVYSLQFVIQPGPRNSTETDMETDPTWRRFFKLASAKAIIDQVALSHYACNFFIYLFTGKVFRNHLHRQMMGLRFFRFICQVCGCGGTHQAHDSAVVYSAVRHSVQADQTFRTGLGNGNARPSASAFPLRGGRRQSGRSSGSTAPSMGGNINGVNGSGNGGATRLDDT